MAAPGETSFCVLEYHTSTFVVTVQRAFRAKYAKGPPTDKTNRACASRNQVVAHYPLTMTLNVRASFLYSPKQSTETAAKELSISKTTLWRVMRKRLVFSCYKDFYNYYCVSVHSSLAD
jgi:transcriptional regulator with PAS, ATPase and Fis domain